MKKIFVILVLFLFSLINNSVLADIGDDYICETSQYVEVNAERKSLVDNETFAFRWNEDEIEFIKMGMGNFSTKILLPKLGSEEMFYSVFYMDPEIPFIVANYSKGELLISMISTGNITTIIASCEKFK